MNELNIPLCMCVSMCTRLCVAITGTAVIPINKRVYGDDVCVYDVRSDGVY